MASNHRIMGMLIVVVLKARNLHDKHQLYKQDVFAEVKLNGRPWLIALLLSSSLRTDKTKRTSVDIKGGQHPVWDEELRFPVHGNPDETHRILQVACYAKEPKSEDILGKGAINISHSLKTGEFDDWVTLENNGAERGEIYLEMTYYASTPSSLQTNLARRPSKLPGSERYSRAPHPDLSASRQDTKRADDIFLTAPSTRGERKTQFPPLPGNNQRQSSSSSSSGSAGNRTSSVPHALRPGRPEAHSTVALAMHLNRSPISSPLSLEPRSNPVYTDATSGRHARPKHAYPSSASWMPQNANEERTRMGNISFNHIWPSTIPPDQAYVWSDPRVRLSSYPPQPYHIVPPAQDARLLARYSAPLPLPSGSIVSRNQVPTITGKSPLLMPQEAVEEENVQGRK
ncbi:hypothetical protein APHAL10511_007458 [Amanita phalloides]|nr:hypothetical protein APHAL10511_007458 [Amanita phalloides]